MISFSMSPIFLVILVFLSFISESLTTFKKEKCPGPNEKYRFCGSRCPMTCVGKWSVCFPSCTKGCFCKAGYIRSGLPGLDAKSSHDSKELESDLGECISLKECFHLRKEQKNKQKNHKSKGKQPQQTQAQAQGQTTTTTASTSASSALPGTPLQTATDITTTMTQTQAQSQAQQSGDR
ncbi:hypothetical protein SSS_04724 [Sarcoptes scabiei]|nr:hypothetical protein SSS_04724 [Sarcoptes scabiei]UXI22874.1 mothers against dpp protein [Sarcoptes scabiei]